MADDVDPGARPRRRVFRAEYKLTILAEYDAAEADGSKGSILVDGRPLIAAISEPGALIHERELSFHIFRQRFTLGTEHLVFEAAVPTIGANKPDGSFSVRFTAGSSDRYLRSLLGV